jgi:hypothetical protein
MKAREFAPCFYSRQSQNGDRTGKLKVASFIEWEPDR